MNTGKLRSALIRYAVCILIAGAMAWLTTDLHGLAYVSDPAVRCRILSDAFTIPGVTFLMLGLLVVVSGAGAFDGLGYALSWAVKSLVPGKAAGRQEKYADYVARKREKGRPAGMACLPVTGALFTAVGVVFLILYYQVQ